MSNELAKAQEAGIWEDAEKLAVIKDMYAPDATNTEFKVFIELGVSIGANPFKREVYFVKYKGKPSYIVSVNLYRRIGVTHQKYNGHFVRPVYENDKVKFSMTGVDHEQAHRSKRGALIGAYCIVNTKGIDFPSIIEVSLNEYRKDQNLWKTSPEMMIKKVAESQALRLAFPEELGGTYSDAEDWGEAEVVVEEVPKRTPLSTAVQEVFNASMDEDLFDDDEINKMHDWCVSKLTGGSKEAEIIESIKTMSKRRFEKENNQKQG